MRYLHAGALELHIRHVEGSPEDKHANYGVRIAYDVFPFDTPAINDVGLFRNSDFTRRKKKKFIFSGKDAGKKVMFCLHYENRKGTLGMLGQKIVTVIPERYVTRCGSLQLKNRKVILINDVRFHLPGKKSLLKEENHFEAVFVDVIERPVERPKKTEVELFGQEKTAYSKNADYCG